jgi:hypothetical protein
MDHEITGNEDEIRRQAVRGVDDLLQLAEPIEGRADVPLGEHGNTEARELRAPVGDDEAMVPRRQRLWLEHERPEATHDRWDQHHKRDASRPPPRA